MIPEESRKSRKDLVVLVADKNMEYTMKGILERSHSLGIKKIDFVIYTHPQRDPGCFVGGHKYLRHDLDRFRYALVIFDCDGCGKRDLTRTGLEREVEERLSSSGWGERAAAVVIEPELENWVWSDSLEVDAAAGWMGKTPSLRTWLREKNYLAEGLIKPLHPKEAFEEALKIARKPRSSSIYKQIADKVSLKRCQDPAFLKLKDILLRWFAVD